MESPTAMKTYTWKEAFEDAHAAAKAGSPKSQNFVGYCYYEGRGVRRDRKIARRWYEKAARNGNVDAIFNLALANDMGQGMRRNARRAVRLYRQLAERGDLQAQANLAAMLLEGDGVKTNTAEGLSWMRRAARRGDSKAQYNLGRAYAYGEDSLKKNIEIAKRWLSKAAKQGHVDAGRLLKSIQRPKTKK